MLKVQNSRLKTTVLFGDPRLPDPVKLNGQFNPEDHEAVQEVKDTIVELDEYEFSYLDHHQTMIQDLMQSRPDFVFNLCDEGFNNQLTKELHVPALLELLDIPYTGAAPACLALCYDKAAVRGIAHSLGIPVPEEIYVTPNAEHAFPQRFPVIIKPNFGDGSFGITQHGVIFSKDDFIKVLNNMKGQFPQTPLLIQQFLSGEEYTVPIIGNPGAFDPQPILHIDYSDLPAELPRMLAHESKWDFNSPYFQKIVFKHCELTAKLKSQLIDYSCMLFERLGCRDYARFDFRLDESGTPHLLEANPNPGLTWLTVEDIAGAPLIGKILTAARNRYQI